MTAKRAKISNVSVIRNREFHVENNLNTKISNYQWVIKTLHIVIYNEKTYDFKTCNQRKEAQHVRITLHLGTLSTFRTCHIEIGFEVNVT